MAMVDVADMGEAEQLPLFPGDTGTFIQHRYCLLPANQPPGVSHMMTGTRVDRRDDHKLLLAGEGTLWQRRKQLMRHLRQADKDPRQLADGQELGEVIMALRNGKVHLRGDVV